jgi:hypothetical protein
MQIKLLGVSMRVSREVPMAAVFADLEERNGEEINYYGKRRIYIGSRKACHVALILSIRDQTRWMQMTEEDDGTVVVEPQEIEERRHMVDFNYLAIDERSGRGLYLYYPGSTSIMGLGTMVAKTHSALLIDARDEWIARKGRTRKNLRIAKEQFKNEFAFSPIVQKKDLAALLAELDTISALQFEFEGIEDSASFLGGLGEYVERTNYKVNFGKKLSANKVAKKIVKQIEDKKPDGGYVVGAKNGQRMSYDLESLPTTVFDRLDYNEVAKVAITPMQFTTAEQLTNMITVLEGNPSVFRRKTSDED